MSAATRRKLRIAAVAYVNARPLVEGLADDPAVELALATPARCSDLLLSGEVQAALVPAATLLRHPHLARVSAGVVAAERRARTVLLVSEAPLDEVRVVHASAASRTSNALARIVCTALSPASPPAFTGPAARLCGGRAAAHVVIGDPAFAAARRFPHVLDLASAWRALTGLPFVFACFAASPLAAPPSGLEELLDRARARGLARLGEIAEESARDLGEDPAMLHEYFERDLHFEITPGDSAALERFGRRLRLRATGFRRNPRIRSPSVFAGDDESRALRRSASSGGFLTSGDDPSHSRKRSRRRS